NRKLCTFDCLYCQYGFNSESKPKKSIFPKVEEILSAWKEKIQAAHQNGIIITHTTLSGNGEPTMHPHFVRMIAKIVDWRNQNAPEMKLALLSNGYRLNNKEIRSAIQELDEAYIKLDSAIPEKLNLINRPITSYCLPKLIKNLQKCGNIMIQ